MPLYIGLGNDFLDITPKTQFIKLKINKWTTSNWKASAQQISQQNEMALEQQIGKTYSQFDKGYLKFIKNSYNPIVEKTAWFKNRQKEAGVAVQDYNPSTQKADAGRWWVQG
jgi:hypothetical protein